jgi:hypothetical protein
MKMHKRDKSVLIAKEKSCRLTLTTNVPTTPTELNLSSMLLSDRSSFKHHKSV